METKYNDMIAVLRSDAENRFMKLQAEHSLLQASFKNYRLEIRDEMNTVLMLKVCGSDIILSLQVLNPI